MSERQAGRKPRASGPEAAEAERQRQDALKAEKVARSGAAVTEVVGEPVDSSFLPDAAPAPPPAKRRTSPKAISEARAEHNAPSVATTRAANAKAKSAPKPKAKAVAAATGSTATKDELVQLYAGIGKDTDPTERHTAVKALAASGLFNYAEIARLTGYANGGVVRNLVIPPVRNRKAEPLAGDDLAAVRALEQALGLTIREIARRTPKAEA